MGPSSVTDLEYGVTIKKYRVSVCFCRKLSIFRKTVG
jgi:hypothetical protein